MNQVGAIQKIFGTISALFHLANELLLIGYFYFTKMAKEIQLTQGKVAIVDDADFEFLNQFKWHALKLAGKFYVGRKLTVSKCKRNQIFMHRFIMKPDKGMVIDHLDGNPLNNQKNNLRICTHSENMRNCKISINNTSGFKGVSFVKKNNTYKSAIKLNKKTIYLGYYIDPIDAAKAYNDAALKYHGEFANLNKID